MDEFDIAILGAGISGISAAKRAAELNAKVCLIENHTLGGRCFHKGLYPYRHMMSQLEKSGVNRRLQDLKGEETEKNTYDTSGLFEETRKFSQSVAGKWESTLKAQGVHIETGEGLLVGANEIRVQGVDEEKIIKAQKIILATGSSIEAPATIPFDEERIISADEVFDIGKVPGSVLILGGDGGGCELATLYNELGSKTFLCDEAPRLLPEQDPNIMEAMEGEMKRQKIKLLLNKKVISIFKDTDAIDISLDGGVKFSVQTIVLTTNRKSLVKGLDAEKLGLRLGEKGQILVDEKQETTLSGVYAVGSVTGREGFHGLSAEEGKVAAENALGKKARVNTDWIPRIVYTNLEIATVGCYAGIAHHQGFRAVEGRCDDDQLDHSLIRNDASGFIKIVADKSSKNVIGGQIVSRHASEYISLILLAIKKGLTVNSLANLSCGISTELLGVREAARTCMEALRR
jgi:pyruvate/2-oxoglutarate dehydrogenase complex dihydrolipoamide dehydrogenase (E3) component